MINKLFQLEKAFDAAFEPVEGGYSYQPWVWSKRYRVTEEEFQRLRSQYLSLSSGRSTGILTAYMVVAVVLLTILDLTLGVSDAANRWIVGAILVPPVAIMFWLMFAPQRLVWGREPIAPRRTRLEQDMVAAKALNWFVIGLTLFMLIPWLTVGVFLLVDGVWWGLLILAAGLLGLFRTVRTIYFKLVER